MPGVQAGALRATETPTVRLLRSAPVPGCVMGFSLVRFRWVWRAAALPCLGTRGGAVRRHDDDWVCPGGERVAAQSFQDRRASVGGCVGIRTMSLRTECPSLDVRSLPWMSCPTSAPGSLRPALRGRGLRVLHFFASRRSAALLCGMAVGLGRGRCDRAQASVCGATRAAWKREGTNEKTHVVGGNRDRYCDLACRLCFGG